MSLPKSLPRLLSSAALSLPMVVATSTIAFANDLAFLLYNKTSVDLVELYVSPTNIDDWEENLMQGGQRLGPRQSTTVTIGDGRTTCMYDILGVFADGDEVDDYEIDLCELESYSFIEE